MPMAALLKFVPPTQLLFGTDYPAEPMETTLNELPKNELPASIQRAQNRENAERLFPRLKA
jgi:predicted TIM-barrel fold metal-dependent hydrolase